MRTKVNVADSQVEEGTVNGIPFDKFENDPPQLGETGYTRSEESLPDYMRERLAEVRAQRQEKAKK